MFHRKVAEGKEPWVMKRTPDDAGALSDLISCRIVRVVQCGEASCDQRLHCFCMPCTGHGSRPAASDTAS